MAATSKDVLTGIVGAALVLVMFVGILSLLGLLVYFLVVPGSYARF